MEMDRCRFTIGPFSNFFSFPTRGRLVSGDTVLLPVNVTHNLAVAGWKAVTELPKTQDMTLNEIISARKEAVVKCVEEFYSHLDCRTLADVVDKQTLKDLTMPDDLVGAINCTKALHGGTTFDDLQV